MKSVTKLVLALGGLGLAQAVSADNWNVNLNSHSPYDRSVDGVYAGSFTYGGQTYGPSTAVKGLNGKTVTRTTVNLAAFRPYVLHNSAAKNPKDKDKVKLGNNGSAGTDSNVVYRIYRQKYSGVIANVTKLKSDGTRYKDRNFVKHIVGENTKLAAFTKTGTFNYHGIAFTNFPTGSFNYQIDLAAKTGQGSFSLNNLLVPAAWLKEKDNKFLNVAGTLNKAAIVARKDGTLGANGSVTMRGVAGAGFADNNKAQEGYKALVANHKSAQYGKVNPRYTLNVYGPKGEEVAGYVNGLPDRIGGVAIVGKR